MAARNSPMNPAGAAISRIFLTRFLREKLSKSGVTPTSDLMNDLTDWLMAGKDPEAFNHHDLPSSLAIEITDEDTARFGEESGRFLDEELPQLAKDALNSSATALRRSLNRRWPQRHALEKEEHAAFQQRLEQRWSAGLNGLRMLLTIAREIGQERSARLQRSRAKKGRLRTHVLLQLHMRGCQVVSEIILLLASGYADGAMSRWRTLHEISVVALLIAKHGDALAERYLAHEVVEAHNILMVHDKTFDTLDFEKPSPRELAESKANYQATIQHYGEKFGDNYGWAAGYVENSRSFDSLVKAAGRSHLHAYYKLASHNIHAGVKGITFKLGALHGGGAFAGASNAGLEEPGQNTAITFTLLTFLLIDGRDVGDNALMLKVLTDLQEQTIKGFVRAGRRLKRDARPGPRLAKSRKT